MLANTPVMLGRIHMRMLAFTLVLLLASCRCDSGTADGAADGAAESAVGAVAATATTKVSASVSAEAKPARMNVVLIIVDSLRADRMPWNGYRYKVAPNIAKFAKTAVNYTRFFSVSSYTAMTFGGTLTGRYPSELPRSGYFFSAYPPKVLTLAEVLQNSGAHSMAVMAHWYFNVDKAGLHQGFDTWELVPDLKKSNTTDQNVTSPKHLQMALAQLRDKATAAPAFFAMYHFCDPHDMYMPHEGTPQFGAGARGMYDGEVHFTDKHVGELIGFIDNQPWADRTAVIITSDHGETFGEHRMYRHGFELWQELILVPLLVRLPGAAPRVIETPRSGIDLAPTILELMAAAPDPTMRGKSLVPELRGGDAKQRAVIADLPATSDNERRRALIWGNYKLIAFNADQYFKLFDIEADPREQRDLAVSKKDVLAQMRERYEEASKSITEVCPRVRKLDKNAIKCVPE